MHLLPELLMYLGDRPAAEPHIWRGWRITPIAGGANNLLFRATNPTADYAVKFTVRDDRDRAGREFAALTALESAGVAFAPRAVFLDRTGYRQPVVVQTWLAGDVLETPPATAADWDALLDHYCRIHAVTPQDTSVALAAAVLNLNAATAGKPFVAHHAARIPQTEQPASLVALLHRFERWRAPVWEPPPTALCRVDANWRNFIRRPGGWASVDWENSGWGDPAFEWADLITHPAYADCAEAPWERLIVAYAERMHDPNAPQRIAAYTIIMRVWWVVRWARYLYEVPRGLDMRLVDRPADWFDAAVRNYERYLMQAETALDRWAP